MLHQYAKQNMFGCYQVFSMHYILEMQENHFRKKDKRIDGRHFSI